MSKTKTLGIVAGVAILVLVIIALASKNGVGKDGSDGNTKTTIDVIHQRTSIRDYRNQPVSKEILEKIVRAGMAAPSAMNKQPWQFIIVDDKDILTSLGEQLPTSSMAKKAAAAILVCGDLQKAGDGWLEQYWIQDCSAASQNILLAITDLGLGGVWTSVYPAEDRMKKVADLLNLPEHIIPLNIIPLGYPSQNFQPKDKWNPENVRWNKW